MRGKTMAQDQLYLELEDDFKLNNNGGLLLGAGWDIIRQNFERFVFTNPSKNAVNGQPQGADWIFSPDFGLGARSMLGQNFGQDFISSLSQKVYQGALSAASGNSNVPPDVSVIRNTNPQQVSANVVITPIGQQQRTLSVSLP